MQNIIEVLITRFIKNVTQFCLIALSVTALPYGS